MDCGQRQSQQCPADGPSAAGAHAKPPGSEGRRNLMLGWREHGETKKSSLNYFTKKISCKRNEAQKGER